MQAMLLSYMVPTPFILAAEVFSTMVYPEFDAEQEYINFIESVNLPILSRCCTHIDKMNVPLIGIADYQTTACCNYHGIQKINRTESKENSCIYIHI